MNQGLASALIGLVLAVAGISAPPVLAQDSSEMLALPTPANEAAGLDLATDTPEMLQRGAWTYDIALDLPPTGQQARPGLGVRGGHRVADALMGLHWEVTGLSAIERRGPTGGVAERAASDTFWFDGQQLYQVETRSDGARAYRLEQDDNRVFVLDAAEEAWHITRDGWNWFYGDDPAAPSVNASLRFQKTPLDGPVCRKDVVAKGKVLRWQLRQSEDPFGNPVSYSYSGDCDCHVLAGGDGEGRYACPHLPKDIRYDQAIVRFQFEPRPDSRVSLRDGVPRISKLRLASLTSHVTSAGAEVPYSTYRFGYAEAGRSLLAYVDQVAADGAVRRLFEPGYDLAATEFAAKEEVAGFEDIEAEYHAVYIIPHVVNFDGDGYPDLVLLDDAENGKSGAYGFGRGYRNRGDGTIGFAPDPALTKMLELALGPFSYDGADAGGAMPGKRFVPGQFVFTDTNGDGRTELHTPEDIWVLDDEKGYVKATPRNGYPAGTFLAVQVPDAEHAVAGDLVVDMNGDGLGDLLAADAPRAWSADGALDRPVKMPLQNGSSFVNQIDQVKDAACGGDGVLRSDAPHASSFGLPTFDFPDDYWDSQTSFGDVNGDGLADLIYAFPNCFDPDPASDPAVWSRVFLGKGDGTFFSSDLEAGPGFIQQNSPAQVGNPPEEVAPYLDWKSFALADFDGDGLAEFVHRPDGQARLYAAHFQDAAQGWATGAESEATIRLPAKVKALTTYVRTGWRPEVCECLLHQVTLLADWNGDAQTDILVFERPAGAPGGLSNGPPARHLQVTGFANTRRAPHYALTSIRNQWGGLTEVTYAGSARNGDDNRMGPSMVVVASVRDERGLSQYHLSGGRLEAGRFLGFAEVEATYQSGFSYRASFSLARPFLGQMVSRTEWGGPDGALDRHIHFVHVPLDPMGLLATYDTEPPYFNPLRRVCDSEVAGGGALVGPGQLDPLGAISEASFLAALDADCLAFGQVQRPTAVLQAHAQLEADLHGWRTVTTGRNRARPTAQSADIQKRRMDPLAQPRAQSWQAETFLPVTPPKGYAQMAPEVSRVFAEIDPNLTTSLPGLGAPVLDPVPPAHRMFLKTMSYTADQRLLSVTDQKNTAVADDWNRVALSYGPYRKGKVQGAEVIARVVTHAGGTALTTQFAGHAAFGFPGKITEIGSDGTERSSTLSYSSRGFVTRRDQVIDAAGRVATERVEFGPCGQVGKIKDAVGRETLNRYDPACRLIETRHAGASISHIRDGFGRVIETRRDDGVFGAASHRYGFDDSFGRSLAAPDAVDVFGTLATFTQRDLWGRPIITRRCELAQAGPVQGPLSPAAMSCIAGSETWRLSGWAEDGSPRLAVSEFRRGERPFVALTYSDARGRLTRQVTSNRAHLEQPADLLAGFPLAGTDGTIETIYTHQMGQKTATEPGGETCTESFDTLWREVRCEGRLMTRYELDAFGHRLVETDVRAVRTEFAYDGFYNLARETSRLSLQTCDGTVTDPFVTYDYDLRGQRLGMAGHTGLGQRWTYDLAGRLLTQTIEPGNGQPAILALQMDYQDGTPDGRGPNGAGSRIGETDINGNRVEQWVDGFGLAYRTLLPDGRAIETERDALGRVVSVTGHDGLITRFDYDARGQEVMRYHLVAANQAQACRVPDGAGRCKLGVTFDHDGAGRIIRQTDADGVTTRLRYNRHGQLTLRAIGPWLMAATRFNDDGTALWQWQEGSFTSFDYDLWKNPVSVCEGSDLLGACETKRELGWTAAGDLASERLGGQWRSRYSHDALGRVLTTERPDGTVERYRYGRSGAVCQTEDAEGLRSEITHDALGRVLSLKVPEFASPRRYAYRFGVPLPGGVFGSASDVTEPDGGVWSTLYDFADRAIVEHRPDGSELRRDWQGGRLMALGLYGPDGVRQEDTRFAYDAMGRLVTEAGPDLQSGFDPARYGFRYSYSDAGRPLAETGPENPATGHPILEVTRDYGVYGLMTAEHHVGVTTTRYAYDLAARYPRLSRIRSGLDPADLRDKRYGYSSGGTRVVFVEHSGIATPDMQPTAQVLRTEFSQFDAYGQPRRTVSTDAHDGQTTALEWLEIETDALGRPVQLKQRVLSEPPREVAFAYRANGQPAHVALRGGAALGYVYDSRGLLSQITREAPGGPAQTALTFLARDPLGRAVDVALSDGGRLRSAFDPMGRLVMENLTLPGGATRQTAFAYDARGLLREERLQDGPQRERAQYDYTPEGWLAREQRFDGRDRLREERQFSYDPAGNRLTQTDLTGQVITYRYGPVDPAAVTGDALLSVDTGEGPQPLVWDGQGGMLRDHRGFGFGRDAAGRETSVWTPDGYLAARLTRDSANRVIRVQAGARHRSHLWANPLSDVFPLLSVLEDGTPLAYLASEARLYGVLRPSGIETAATDLRGSLQNDGPRLIHPLSAFGEGVSRPQSGVPFVFAGQELVDNSPYLTAQERLYDPETGSFASVDPLGRLGPRHRFRYAGNAPTAHIDPWGTDFESDLDQSAGDGSDMLAAPSGSGDATHDEGKLDFTGQNVAQISGWSTLGGDVVSPEGDHYPIDESHIVQLETTTGEFVSIIAHFFYDGAGEYQFVGFGYEPGQLEDTASPAPAADQPSAGDGITPAPGEVAEIAGAGGEGMAEPSTTDPTHAAETQADIFVPSNFTGTPAEWAAREAEGFTIDEFGLATTPGGAVVIMGMNDNLNPLPHKVLVNIGADFIDGALTENPMAFAAQAAGLMSADFSPANQAIKDAGWGYTASEQGREWIAETSMSIAASAVTAPVAAAAEARAVSVMARGCQGPMRFLPRSARILAGVTCFAPETLVRTEQGGARIDGIQPGDRVLCSDPETGEQQFCRVTAVMLTPNRAFLDLALLRDGGEDHLRVTANHRFWVETRGWTEARDIRPGDVLRGARQTPATVVAVAESGTGGLAYNLEVEGLHTYFVGQFAVLAHNGGPAGTCPASEIRNQSHLATLLGRTSASADTVSVGDIKQLLADGKITQTALGSYLRGKSGTRRAEIIRLAAAKGEQIYGRVGDSHRAVSLSEARNGNLWHIGHQGVPLRDLILQADPAQSVADFRSFHWSQTTLEWAQGNVGRGAGTTGVDSVFNFFRAN